MKINILLLISLFITAKTLEVPGLDREVTPRDSEGDAILMAKENRRSLRGTIRSLFGLSQEPGDSNNQAPPQDRLEYEEDPDYRVPSPTLPTTDTCTSGSKVCIDFSLTPDGRVLKHGDYVNDEWFDGYGMTIDAAAEREGYTPDGKARIYDTAVTKGEDPDLRSPNERCSPPGPGVGEGGEPDMPGENCEPQGNVLIVQRSNKPEPDDNWRGGSITLNFFCPLEELLSVGLMDIKNDKSSLKITSKDSNQVVHKIDGLGSNSVQVEQFVDMKDVSRVELDLYRTGAMRHVCFCLDENKCRPPGAAPPTESKTKKFTYSFKKNWKSNGDYEEGKGTRILPQQGTELGHLLPNPTISTKYPLSIDEDEFVTLIRMGIASWQSVVGVRFEQVESNGDVVFEVVGNIAVYYGWTRNGDWYLTGAGGYGPSGRVIFGLYRRTTGSPPYSEEEYLPYNDSNYVYFQAMHELGHVIKLSHTKVDKGQYAPIPLMNTAVMDYKWHAVDGKIKQYLNNLDISRAQSIWGPSIYEPLIQLWIPSWNKHFYTTSWDEANSLVKLGFASDVQWFYGVMAKNAKSSRRPLYRSFNGRYKHRYTLDGPHPPIALTPTAIYSFFNEGIMGYLWRNAWKNLTPLYRFYQEENDDFLLSVSKEVPGYTNRTRLGYIIGFNAMVGNSTELAFN